jgi:hypothetical protein
VGEGTGEEKDDQKIQGSTRESKGSVSIEGPAGLGDRGPYQSLVEVLQVDLLLSLRQRLRKPLRLMESEMEDRSEDHLRLARALPVEARPRLRTFHHHQTLDDLWSGQHGERGSDHRANVVAEEEEGRDGEG